MQGLLRTRYIIEILPRYRRRVLKPVGTGQEAVGRPGHRDQLLEPNTNQFHCSIGNERGRSFKACLELSEHGQSQRF